MRWLINRYSGFRFTTPLNFTLADHARSPCIAAFTSCASHTGNLLPVPPASVDYLIRDEENVAVNKIKSKALLRQIEEINKLPDKDQEVVISFLDAFIKRRKFEELVST